MIPDSSISQDRLRRTDGEVGRKLVYVCKITGYRTDWVDGTMEGLRRHGPWR